MSKTRKSRMVGTLNYYRHSPGVAVACRRTSVNTDALWMHNGTWKRERSIMPFERGPKVAPMGVCGLVIRKLVK